MSFKRARDQDVNPAKRTRRGLNDLPSLPKQRLNTYMFGSSALCELGLGPRVTEVKRPRLNPLLPSDSVGVVALTAGGAHSLAIDHSGAVWSWGQNDSGCLGRATKEGPDELDEDNDLNAKESTPKQVEGLPAHLSFAAIGATDNCSVAITEEGRVWAWGTFIDDGNKAFSPGTKYQREPTQLPSPRNIVTVAAGRDHLLFVNTNGQVYAWGVGSSSQLGVRVNPFLRTHTVGPVRVPVLKNIINVFAGDYQSFALDAHGNLWAWGLNNFGQLGIPEPVGANVVIERPTQVPQFWPEGQRIVQVASGSHHTAFLTSEGELWTVGETNFHQLGIPYDESLPKNTVREQDGTPSYVPNAVRVKKGINEDETVDLPPMKFVAAGTDHTVALSKIDGTAWTWGFGEMYQLGHGKPAGEDQPEDESLPRRIKNTATTGVNMCWAGAGGQFCVIAAPTD